MMNRRRFLQRFASGATALLLTQGCTSTNATSTTATPPSTTQGSTTTPEEEQASEAPSPVIRVGFTGVPKQMQPALYSVIEEYQLGFAIFDGLVWVDETLTPQPLLAKSWKISPDSLTWTFTLEEEVLFHHGEPFTSADVVHTFTRLLDPQVGSAFRSVLRFVKQVEALDEYTVRFQLATPNVELPLLLGSPQASIVSQKYPDQLMAVHPSGTGPFQFVEFIPGDRVRLERNKAYWATSDPYIDQLEYLYQSYEEQLQGLQAGTVDVITQVSTDYIAKLQADPNTQVVTAQSGSYQTIVMQATEAPFTDIRVRKALKFCADHAALRQTVLQGRGMVGNNHPVAPISPFWNQLPEHRQDLAQAKALLAQAGYAKGLQLDLITSTSRPGMVELALAFREMAKQIGITIQVVRVPADVYWSDYGGKTPFHVGNWGFRPSIDETFMVAYHSTAKSNESKWKNPKLDELIDQARGEQNAENRKAYYQQAQQLIEEEGAVIVPYFRPVAIALRQNIQGFVLHPAGWLDFSTVQLAAS
ncbi:MAG: ABC transporter substrate-binding protein [Caldilineaceae bacterium]|nr:ABC transporter substrate-binding protein [Caldilineaceae bacterium]